MVYIAYHTPNMSETFPPIIRPSNYIATWEESRWLVASSVSFLAPAIYAHHLKHYYHAWLLVATTMISMNFWRKATHSWRYSADLVCAKIAFTTFVSTGVLYIPTPTSYAGYLLLAVLLYNYRLSHKLYEVHNPDWVKHHALFHLYMTIESFIIIYYLSVAYRVSGETT